MKKRILAALVLLTMLAAPLTGLAASQPNTIVYADDLSYVIIDGAQYAFPPRHPMPPPPWQGPGYVSPDGSYYLKFPPYPYPYPYAYPYFRNQQFGGPDAQTDEQAPGRASYGNITWSTEYLYQVYVNNRSIDFRVFGDGVKRVFKLAFDGTEYGTLRMTLTVRGTYDDVKLVFTSEALEYLEALGVGEISLVTSDGAQRYGVSTLRTMAQ